jgi:hypothetical protein
MAGWACPRPWCPTTARYSDRRVISDRKLGKWVYYYLADCGCSVFWKRFTMKVNHMDIMHTNSDITFNDRVEHFLIHWGYRREHRVAPGLCALGNPDKGSPVFVTANYRLSLTHCARR